MPAFMLISLRTGPFTTTMPAMELVEEPRALAPEEAMARITGKYSGRAPAMTALTATCSTVHSHSSRKCVAAWWPTISSGLRLVCLSMAATRSSVGSTTGSLSVQLLSRKR